MNTEILKTAEELLNGDRAKAYGDVTTNFKAIATIANAMLRRKGIELDVEDVAIVLVALKLAREGNAHKRDNLIDAAAYLNILDVLQEEVHKKQDAVEDKQPITSDVNQRDIAEIIEQEVGVVIATCGHCGGVVLHAIGIDHMTCPHCNKTEDSCHFPSLY